MSIFRFILCLAGLALVSHAQAKAQPAGLASPLVHNQIGAKVSLKPMTFFVVKGEPDSCGRGCSQWIVAEGKFERDTGTRFKEFIATASRRNLPVFLHSSGGNLAAAIEMATLMRDHGMMAGVGRTTAEGCTAFGSTRGCRTVMDSGKEVRGKLREDVGACISACVYAFAGASTRRVFPGAILAVHSARLDQEAIRNLGKADAAKIEKFNSVDVHKGLKWFLMTWGVDPELENIAAKVSPARMYILSRAEIDRLGFETRDSFETPWYILDKPSGVATVAKAMTQLIQTPSREFGTIQFNISCAKGASSGLTLDYISDLPLGPSWLQLRAVIVSAGDVRRSLHSLKSPRGDIAWAPIEQPLLQAMVETKVIRFEVAAAQFGAPRRVIEISAAGLAEQLVELRKRCPQTT